MTLPPDPDSVVHVQAIKRVHLQVAIWSQSLDQDVKVPLFEQNGWRWCDSELMMVHW